MTSTDVFLFIRLFYSMQTNNIEKKMSRSRSSYFFKFLLCLGSFSGKTKKMMHTAENTNIDIIKQNYEKLEDKTKDNK
jgi:hypothetical protein